MFASHYVVGSTIIFSQDHRYFRHGCLAVCVEKFGAMFDYSAVLLLNSRQETWNVYEGYYGDVEGVAETYEPACFHRAVNVQSSSVVRRLVGYDSNGFAVEAGETYDNVLCPERLNLEEITIVHDSKYDFFHVVGFVSIVWEHFGKVFICATGVVSIFDNRWILHVVAGQVTQNLFDNLNTVFLVFRNEVGNTAGLAVNHCSA